MKPAKLSVHRNNKRQRDRKERRGDLMTSAREATKEIQDLDGYVVVAWDSDGTSIAKWRTNRVPGTLVGEMAKRTVERAMNAMDHEDWHE